MHDHCLLARSKTDSHTFSVVWDDEVMVASTTMTVVSNVKKAPENTIKMEYKVSLGIGQEDSKATVNQKLYIETKLERFQIGKIKPSDSNCFGFEMVGSTEKELDHRIYENMDGSIRFRTITQIQAACLLSKFCRSK